MPQRLGPHALLPLPTPTWYMQFVDADCTYIRPISNVVYISNLFQFFQNGKNPDTENNLVGKSSRAIASKSLNA